MRISTNRVVLILALLGMVGLAMLARSLYLSESTDIQQAFHTEVDQYAVAFEREVLLNLEILYALNQALATADSIDPDVFNRVTRGILRRSPAIQAFAWAPLTHRSERPALEAGLQQLVPGLVINERNAAGEIVPADDREWYVPVALIEPMASNQVALGYDLGSERRRLSALLEARDTGRLVATAGIRLVQEPENQQGFLVFSPLYHGEPADQDQRRQQLRGFFNGVFRVGELFNQSIGLTASGEICLRIVDRTTGQDEILLESIPPGIDLWHMPWRYESKVFDVAGRQWLIEAVPAHGFVVSQRGYLPWLVLGTGLLFICLLSGYVIATLRRNEELQAARDQLEHISLTDGLTGLANRRHFDQHLAQEWARAQREGISVSLIMIDIDHFKSYNDEYGHPAGDQCLRRVAEALQGMAQRPLDLVARYGGEEFAIILPQTQQPLQVAEQCRQAVEALQLPHAFSEAAKVITISAGVCTRMPGVADRPEALTEGADHALYEAKETGRNRVKSCARPD
ncbi:CHASE domain-containing protein [Saccharospirillum mangrovi]|uniref:CHASE domain-containing protein n=1 Tax=Saccharospirillum mangrovi TaxID=2161747 RepID=UPI00130041C2|nr:diguanylate cyclase [Saccharospirillum mangrovi]